MSDRSDVYALYEEGRSRLAAGDPQAAVEVLERAVAREPDKASIHETLARACFATARVGRARAAFARAVELDPTDAYAHFGLARCCERQNDLPEAAKHLKLACALSGRPDYVAALDRVNARIERRPPTW